MKKALTFILVLPLALVFFGAALAVEIWTPPLRNEGDVMGCVILNVGSTPVQVTAELMDEGGVVNSGTLSIGPGRARQVTYTTAMLFGATCKFYFNGSKKKVRGFAVIQDSGGSTTRVIVEAK